MYSYSNNRNSSNFSASNQVSYSNTNTYGSNTNTYGSNTNNYGSNTSSDPYKRFNIFTTKEDHRATSTWNPEQKK